MTLLIDVGNSAIKWAQLGLQGELLRPQWQLHRGVADIAARLVEHWRELPRETTVVGCNVGGAFMVRAIDDATTELRLAPITWLHAQPRFDGPVSLINGYRDPLQLGADRWHCLLGACVNSAERGSLIVVNAGTATTVDCIEALGTGVEQEHFTGRFIGGFIAPGTRLMLDSLARETAGLPAIAAADCGHATFPDTTAAAIVSGVLDAQAGLVQQTRRRFTARLASEPEILITGGHAAALHQRLSIDSALIVDNLVLRGLALRAPAR